MYKHMGCDNMLKIENLVDGGYISAANDPERALTIYNYTKKTQFEGKWVDQTKWCRGMVIDDDLNIVIECPPKFFNQGEPEAPDITNWDPRDLVACEKWDGYYISVRKDSKYGLIVTSRGSFSSQYAEAAKKLLPPLDKLETDVTYFCELCQDFPEDASIIVTRYKDPMLVLWGVSDRETGRCRPPMPYEGYERDWKVAKQLNPAEVSQYLTQEVEGIVVYNWKTGERVKVKTQWYLDVHRAINGISQKRTIEALMDGAPLSRIENLPEEHKVMVEKWEQEALTKFDLYIKLGHFWATSGKTPKEIAALPLDSGIKSVAFTMLKGKDYVPVAWKQVKRILLSKTDNE